MKIDFPKIVRSFPLSEYAPEIPGDVFVWVNPPVKTLDKIATALGVIIDSKMQDGVDDFLAVLSELLSQGEVASHWSLDDLKDLFEKSSDTDPSFWEWFQNRVLQTISEHRQGRKKA